MNETKENKPFSFLLRQHTKGSTNRLISKDDKQSGSGNDIDRDTPRVAPLPPQRVILPTSSPIVQIACGLHHTVCLTQNGEVYTFGSNQYGQLGSGDLLPYSGPVHVKLNSTIVQIAAGSNHTVLMSSRGVVYTFGNHLKGQLGRMPHDLQHNVNFLDDFSRNQDASGEEGNSSDINNLIMIKQKFLWNCNPGQVA